LHKSADRFGESPGLAGAGGTLHEVTMIGRRTSGDGVFLCLLPWQMRFFEIGPSLRKHFLVESRLCFFGKKRENTLLPDRRGLYPIQRVQIKSLQIKKILVEDPIFKSHPLKVRNGK